MNSIAPLALSQETSQSALGDAGAAYRRGFSEGIKPVARMTVSEWADEYRFLSSKEGDEPGRWQTSRTPYLREIMDCLSVTHPATDVVFRKGSQIGGTEAGHCWIGYVIAQAPGAMMYVLPSSDTSARTSKQRLAAMMDETPELRARIPPARSRDSGNTTRMKEFPGGVLVMASSKSAAELKSMPVRYLYADEIDEYPDDLDGQGDALALAERRTGGRGRAKKFKTSTPTVKGFSRIDREFERTDQRYFYVPCPHCAHEQQLLWSQIRYEQRAVREYTCTLCGVVSDAETMELGPCICPACGEYGEANDATLRTTTTDEVLDIWHECASCGERMEERHKPAMLAAGRWIAHRPGGHRPVGFHLSALYSPLGWYSWRQAVQEYLDSEGKPKLRKVWTNTVLGESYEDSFEQPSHLELQQRADTDYLIRTVPMGGLLLTASVDVQGNRLEAKVKAWGRGEESWLIDHQVLHGDPVLLEGAGTVWAQLDALLDRTWPHAGGGVVRIAAMAIDSGGHHTHTVYEYCRRRAHRHVFAIKGASQPGKAILGKPTLVDVSYNGRTLPEGVKLWPIGTDTAKELVYQRLNIATPGPGYMHWPLGLPQEYFQQLTAEKLMRVTTRAGFETKRWVKDGTARNEALDLEVYAYAAALYVGIQRVNWDKLEQVLVPRQRDLVSDMQAPVPAETVSAPVATPTPPPAVIAKPAAPRGRVLGRIINQK